MAMPSPPLVSLRELARQTGLSIEEITRMRDECGLPVYRVMRKKQLVRLDEFWEWFNGFRHTKPTKPHNRH
jgi:hypothetical protein